MFGSLGISSVIILSPGKGLFDQHERMKSLGKTSSYLGGRTSMQAGAPAGEIQLTIDDAGLKSDAIS